MAILREGEAGQMQGRDHRTLFVLKLAFGYRGRVSGFNNSRTWTESDYMTRRTLQLYTEEIHDRLNEADPTQLSESASHLSLLAEIKSQLKENNALIKAGTPETRKLTSAWYAEILCTFQQADPL